MGLAATPLAYSARSVLNGTMRPASGCRATWDRADVQRGSAPSALSRRLESIPMLKYVYGVSVRGIPGSTRVVTDPRPSDPNHRIVDDGRPEVYVDLSNLQTPSEQLRRVSLAPNKNAIVLELHRYSVAVPAPPPTGERATPQGVTPSPHGPPAPARALPDPHASPPPYLGPTPPAFARKRKTPPRESPPPPGDARGSGVDDRDGPPAARKVKLLVKSPEEKERESARRSANGALRVEDLVQ